MDLTEVGADHARPHRDAPGSADQIVDHDLQVRKSLPEAGHELFQALGTRSLTWHQRDVLPIRGAYLVEKIRVVLVEGPVKRFNGPCFYGERRGSLWCG